MTIIRYVPLFGIVLILYNIFFNGTGSAEGFDWNADWVTMGLPSGAELVLSYSEGCTVVGLLVLLIELMKSTSVSNHAIAEQVLSVVVFIAFLFQFLNSQKGAEPTFLMLTMMSMLDMLAGFIIMAKVARRDINLGGS